MGKTNEKVVENQVEETTQNAVVLTENTVSDLIEQNQIGNFLKGKKRAGFSLTSEYLEMEEGELRRFVVMGEGKMKGQDDDGNERIVDCIMLVGDDGKTYKSAQAVIVGELRGKNYPFAVEIQSNGKVKMSGGRSYHSFDIFPLQ